MKNSILRALALRGYLTRDIHNPIEYFEAIVLERPMLNFEFICQFQNFGNGKHPQSRARDFQRRGGCGKSR